jgi:uncharacterized protein (TIGR02217 family)
MALFNAVQGRYDSFLYQDPDFNAVTAQYFATGNGTAGPFQLVASYANSGGPTTYELIQNLNGTPTLYDNGTLISSSNYSISATGAVTFGSGHFPVSGHLLTWTGSFYYRCRFDADKLDFQKFMAGTSVGNGGYWWKGKVAFTSVKL